MMMAAQVERHLRLNDEVLRFFTLRPRTRADLLRCRKGYKSKVWSDSSDQEGVE